MFGVIGGGVAFTCTGASGQLLSDIVALGVSFVSVLPIYALLGCRFAFGYVGVGVGGDTDEDSFWGGESL